MPYVRDGIGLRCTICGHLIGPSGYPIQAHERSRKHKLAVRGQTRMYTYHQATGEMLKPDGIRLAFGFAGQGPGLNAPNCQAQHDIGPLPQGDYTMTQWIEKDPKLGLCVIVLEPDTGTPVFGRAGFRIHGARNLAVCGLAEFLQSSEGCICIGDCTMRKGIWDSGDRKLKVVE